MSQWRESFNFHSPSALSTKTMNSAAPGKVSCQCCGSDVVIYIHVLLALVFILSYSYRSLLSSRKKMYRIIILLPESHRLFNTVSFFSSEAATEYSYIYIHDKRFYEFVNYQLNCFMRLHYGNYFTFTISFFIKATQEVLTIKLDLGDHAKIYTFFTLTTSL